MSETTEPTSEQNTTDAPPTERVHRVSRVLSVARWVSVVVCVVVLGYRYVQVELDDYIIDVTPGSAQPIVTLSPVPDVDEFTHPTARELALIGSALVEEPRERRQAARQLNAITSRPELIDDDPSVYLTLRTAYWQLRRDPRVVGSYDAAMILVDAAERLDYRHRIASAQAADVTD